MFVCYFNSIIILSYLLSVNSIKINKIQNARIINSTSTLQSNCSTCICQCITYVSSSTSCCYVNCYINNNTCQVVISSPANDPTITIDETTAVYSTNCSAYLNTNKSMSPTTTGTPLIISSTSQTTATLTSLVTPKAANSTVSISTVTYTTPWWCPVCGRR